MPKQDTYKQIAFKITILFNSGFDSARARSETERSEAQWQFQMLTQELDTPLNNKLRF